MNDANCICDDESFKIADGNDMYRVGEENPDCPTCKTPMGSYGALLYRQYLYRQKKITKGE